MQFLRNSRRRTLTVLASALAAVAATTAVALAAGGSEVDTKPVSVKVKCPPAISGGSSVECRLTGRLPLGWRGPKGERGPRGAKGANGAKGATGAKGDKGDAGSAGAAGAPGAPGAPGVSGYEIVSQTFPGVFVPNSNNASRGLSSMVELRCPAGKKAVGGGADLGTNSSQNGVQRQLTISASVPLAEGEGWGVQLFNNSINLDVSIDVEVYAICASVG